MIDQLKVAISEKDIDKARRVMVSELLTTDYPHEVFRDAIDTGFLKHMIGKNYYQTLKIGQKVIFKSLKMV